MKWKLMAVAALMATSAAALAQMGPGAMGGYGPGPHGMRPGMMGGNAPGGCAMGPGMMGGYGAGGYGIGPGMMGGYGMGSGGMHGFGPGGRMGWHHGPGGYGALDLSAEQRAKIADIRRDFSRKQWALMGAMHEQRDLMHDLFASGNTDDAALRKAYQAMADTHKQIFDASLDIRKRMETVLTKEQRDQLLRGGRGDPGRR